jgi:hypothetical protein
LEARRPLLPMQLARRAYLLLLQVAALTGLIRRFFKINIPYASFLKS